MEQHALHVDVAYIHSGIYLVLLRRLRQRRQVVKVHRLHVRVVCGVAKSEQESECPARFCEAHDFAEGVESWWGESPGADLEVGGVDVEEYVVCGLEGDVCVGGMDWVRV